MALALPPLGVWPAFFVALPIWALLLFKQTKAPKAFLLSLAFFGTQNILSLYWLGAALLIKPEQHAWLLPFACLLLPLALALLPAFASFLWWRVRRPEAGSFLLLAFALSMAEFLRGHLLTGFPWNLTGSIWHRFLEIFQALSIFGAYGLGALTFALALLAVPFWLSGRKEMRGLFYGWGVFLLLALWGAWRLAAAPVPFTENATDATWLRLVQPAIAQGEKQDAQKREEHFTRLLDLSRQATSDATSAPVAHSIAAVIWPETAVPFFLTEDLPRRLLIGANMPSGALLLTGNVVRQWYKRRGSDWQKPSQPHYYNSLLALDGSGHLLARYDKAHLVPFGEYVPLRATLERFLPLRSLAGTGADFSAGAGPDLISLKSLPPFSPLICYEGIFPARLPPAASGAPQAGDKPAWILNITNDAWFGHTAGPYQHWIAASMRAVEAGLPLVRVANTGLSGLVDAYGRVVAQTELGARTSLDVALPPQAFSLQNFMAGPVLMLIWVLLIWGAGLGALFCHPVLPQKTYGGML